MENNPAVPSSTPTAGIKYVDVAASYLDERKLKKHAGWILLWALGVGAVISGMYSGWNLGIGAGGFGGMAIATALMTVMYICMVYSIAELSSALPHAGGFYSFARNAFGPWGGMLVGVSDTIEYVLTPAVIVFFIGGFMNTLLPAVPLWVWWASFYAVFTVINIKGVEITFKVGLIVTILAIAVLLAFFVLALATGSFHPNLLMNIEPKEGGSSFLPFGSYGIFAAIPFAIWFYLAIEQLPLAAEETKNVVEDMPKALIYGIATLVVLALLTLVLNTGVGGGAATMGASGAPLPDGFKAIFGEGLTTAAFTIIALVGLVASFHTVIYAAGRVLFALSRSGYYPQWISVTGKTTHTPHRALILSAVVGFVIALVCSIDTKTVGAALLSMSVFGAVISYAVVMAAYIKLKITRPDMPRPYKSPLGVPGAVIGVTLAVIGLAATMAVESNRPGVIGTAIFLVIMLVYFALYSSKRLVAKAPEEEVALVAEAEKELAHK
ncbi:MAG: ethanolamine permease [Candidatus Methylacidiphilales bacterium]|nr:ethanolamine permease [Candidatus Methylacidiphilales bacterium]